jgi:hypothetical protein
MPMLAELFVSAQTWWYVDSHLNLKPFILENLQL